VNRGCVSTENNFLNPDARFDKVRQQSPYNQAGNGSGDYPPPNAWSTGFSRYCNRVFGGYGVDGPSLSETTSFEKCGRGTFAIRTPLIAFRLVVQDVFAARPLILPTASCTFAGYRCRIRSNRRGLRESRFRNVTSDCVSIPSRRLSHAKSHSACSPDASTRSVGLA
jgi:hypothetical protein